MQVNISIQDVNDNAPEFASSSLNISVQENTHPSHIVYQVHAVDKDSGEYGKVTYQLTENPGTWTPNFDVYNHHSYH